jgi:hypothetical protein
MSTCTTGTTSAGTYTYDPGFFNTIGTGSTITTAPHPVILNVYGTGVVSQLTAIALGGFNGLNN